MKNYYFCWNVRFHWKRWAIERDYYLDGGSVEWTFGPITIEKIIVWRS